MAATQRASEQLGALGRTRAHVLSETTNSLEQIMATVSADVCYLMPDVSQPTLPIAVLLDRDAVADFYRAERTFLEVVDSCDLVELSSDWYVFHEGLSTTREVATGKMFQHTYVVLFPVATDGIIGEILWPRQSLAELYGGVPLPADEARSAADFLALRRRHQATHDAYLDALRAADETAARALWSPEARIAVRVGSGARRPVIEGTGPAPVGERVRGLCSALEDPEVTVLQRVIGDWYVFADWILRGRPRHSAAGAATVEMRIASIHPMTASAQLAGELAYGLDETVVDDEMVVG